MPETPEEKAAREAEAAEREAERAELAALREEKLKAAADRAEAEKAERDAERAELEQHRKDKADREAAAARKVTAPKPTATKAPKPDDEPVSRPKSRVSRSWFGAAADTE